MPRKRSEAEGSEGDGKAGGRLAQGPEVCLAQPGQDQSADAGRCRRSRERSGSTTHHRQPGAVASRRLPGPAVLGRQWQGTPCQPGGIFDRGGGGHRMCTKVITIPNL